MLSQGVTEEAEHVCKQLCMGCSQPRLHSDHGGEGLFEILNGNIVEWARYPQRILFPRVAEPTKPPILVIIGFPPESHGRSAQPCVGLNCLF